MTNLEKNLKNRDWLKSILKAEIIGPDNYPNDESVIIDDAEIVNLREEDLYKPKAQRNGEEILWQDSPLKRYGAGILFPADITEMLELSVEEDISPFDNSDDDGGEYDDVLTDSKKNMKNNNSSTKIASDESEDYDVSLTNAHRPSAMGMSFMMSENNIVDLEIEISFAVYEKRATNIIEWNEKDRKYTPNLWLRKPAKNDEGENHKVVFTRSDLLSTTKPLRKWVVGHDSKLEIIVVVRSYDSGNCLITITLLNTQKISAGDNIDEKCFFQCAFSVTAISADPVIHPYPEVHRKRDYDDEQEILRLLYRDKKTYAVGHGCAAEWEYGLTEGVYSIRTQALPEYQTPTTSADLFDKHDESLKVSMCKLAGLDKKDDGTYELRKLANAYAEWIDSLHEMNNRKSPDGVNIPIPDELKDTAGLLINRCGICLDRINAGIDYLYADSEESKKALQAFRLTNHAMLLSQLRASRNTRKPLNNDDEIIEWDTPIERHDPTILHSKKGYWRPFQIAFLLMTIKGITQPHNNVERDVVDLIWFPTGGGKTEAYLGLTAFTIFYNRLANINVAGCDVIMRYTLRLLTAQQFQRAATLFCSMEFLRKNEFRELLGEKEFNLGMWVGGDATPNRRADAKTALNKLKKDPKSENPFVLLKCPWCNAKMGPKDDSDKGRQNVYGYQKYRNKENVETVVYRCEDHRCDFGGGPLRRNNPPLPIMVIDDDIIACPPSLLIGTVDKFAMLTWSPGIRAIFGIDNNGKHPGLPPSLIIQDELHLISGPLGSMVGAYETVIEELCTSYVDGVPCRPKIVASTATISRANDQIKALYARNDVMLFPPSGLEASDSFFSKESRDANNKLSPGRLYIGVMAPGHGSLQTTQSRVYARLLYAAIEMDAADSSERDPWWTLLAFFNSLRELGGATTLFTSDVQDYLKVLSNRYNSGARRYINALIELTSRIRGDHIPQAIQLLEKGVKVDNKGKLHDAVDVCLASSIIEVGVDIDRLSLMAIVGQPKTTSQYIQVSSRVGRSLEAPGLVITMFSQGKPRDRSHYEKFSSYHQSLYAQVEPTSVTPFSPPAVDRALHSIMIAIVRQLSPIDDVLTEARPFPLEYGTVLKKRIEDLLNKRVLTVDSSEQAYVSSMIEKRVNEWKAWNPLMYGGFGAAPEDAPLMHPAGSYQPISWYEHSWPTLMSLRSVDASCEAEVTTSYNDVVEGQ